MRQALLFSGQGAQSVGMGRALHEKYSVVRDLYSEASEVLKFDLAKVSFEGPEEELTKTSVCQPALFVHGWAIYAAAKEAGKIGEVVASLGLSLGELTALSVAGSFSFAEGVRLVAERGRLMQEACEQTDGAMASVIGGVPEDVQALCEEFDVDMANWNCPGQIVISGEREKVAQAVEAGKSRSFKQIIPLKVAGAYHSRLMSQAGEVFAGILKEASIVAPTLPVFSNTTGEQVQTPDEIRIALAKQVASPVLWEACMRSAAELNPEQWLECGPRKILAGLARRTDKNWSVISPEDELVG